MKRIYISLLLLCSAIVGIAQTIPNANFSEWGTVSMPALMGGGTYSSPSGGWDCLNLLVPGSVSQAEGRTAGSTAALLESKTIDMSAVGMPDTFTTSILSTDNYVNKMSGYEYAQGVECSSISNALTFWYKYEPVGTDVAQVFIQFNEDYLIQKDVTRTLKFRTLITEPTSEWKKGVVMLNVDEDNEMPYMDWNVAAYVIDITSSASGLSSSTEGVGGNAGSKLWITDLAFTNEDMSTIAIAQDDMSAIKTYKVLKEDKVMIVRPNGKTYNLLGVEITE